MNNRKTNLSRRGFFAAFIILSLSALACGALIPTSPPTPRLPPPFPLPTAIPSTVSSEPTSPPDTSVPTPTPETFTLPADLGEDVPIAGADHIDEGAVATDWNSDPPTSGQHFGQWAPAGFYDDEIADGYLVHNMEHGYVVVYYNCSAVTETDCETFKSAIETAMAAAGNDPNTNTIKIIAVPRPGMDNPITYASWGHLYNADTFAPEELILYVQTYRSNADYAPEASLP
jgi:hypothetical protein